MKNNFSLKKSITTALMAAVISALSPISITIPMSPVPISLSTFAIYLTLYILGATYGTISTMIYVLLGIIGAPVFTGFSGGIGKILGPTGGYIIAYIFMAIIAGCIIERNYSSGFMCFLGMAIGTIVLYIVGTLWLSHILNMTFIEGLGVGVIPFIPGDIVKMVFAYIIGKKLRLILSKGGYV